MDPVIYIAGFGTLGVASVMAYVFKSVVPISSFIHSNARIQAKAQFMVDDHKLPELADAKSLAELNSALRETDYGEELESRFKGDLRTFHLAIENSFRKSVFELVKLSPKKSKPIFNAWLGFLEGKVLKTIYRTKFYKLPVDKNLVFAVGSVNEILLRHLVETETIADVNVVMKGTPYEEVFSKEYSTLEEFEVALDEFILNNFVKTAKKTKMYEAKYILDILNKKVDILNILALIKFKLRGIEKEKQGKLLVHNKTDLSRRFEALIETESIKELVEACKGLAYHEALADALAEYEKDSSLFHFEHQLYKFYKKFVVSADIAHILGPYPLFSYLVKKEFEQRNLFVISRGIDAAFAAERIKGMVV